MNIELARELAAQLALALKPNVVVKPGDNLQAVINNAIGGDTIEIAPGLHTVGELVFPPKSSNVTLVGPSSNSDRVAVDEVLPVITSGSAARTLNLTNAANWTFKNLEFAPRADGLGEVITCQDSSNINFSRIRIIGSNNGQKRAIKGNGQNIALLDSYIANIWQYGQDSQAFCAWDGAGPYTLVNNYLEAAGENVMFGGADSLSVARIPADIIIENNIFTKRDEWRGQGKSVKNLFELKAAKRVTVRNNAFSNNWTDAQNGYAILVKSVNQNGTAPWSVTEDVLFENNTLQQSTNGINILGISADQPGGRTTRITFRRNKFQTSGVGFQIGGGAGDITIEQNTITNGWTFMQLYGNKIANLLVKNNIGNHNDYGVKGDGSGIGTPSLNNYTLAYVFTNNVLLNGAGKGNYPATTYFTLASVPTDVTVGA